MVRLTNSPLKKVGRNESWIPAFAGMTIYEAFAGAVIPAKAGIQGGREFFNGLLMHFSVLLQRVWAATGIASE